MQGILTKKHLLPLASAMLYNSKCCSMSELPLPQNESPTEIISYVIWSLVT